MATERADGTPLGANLQPLPERGGLAPSLVATFIVIAGLAGFVWLLSPHPPVPPQNVTPAVHVQVPPAQ